MSHQRKNADSARTDKGPSTRASRTDLVGVGNAAMQDRLRTGVGVERPGLDVVRAAARPIVDRALLALQVVPRGPAAIDRFSDIVGGSELPGDRKTALIDRLRTDEAAASVIGDAVQRWFGADNDELRGALTDGLGTIRRGLDAVPDEAVVEGTVTQRALALIADIAKATIATETASPEAVRGFCSDVLLALLWDEDEEQLEEPGEDVDSPR
jgi:hypothetical protein